MISLSIKCIYTYVKKVNTANVDTQQKEKRIIMLHYEEVHQEHAVHSV